METPLSAIYDLIPISIKFLLEFHIDKVVKLDFFYINSFNLCGINSTRMSLIYIKNIIYIIYIHTYIIL